MLKIVRPAQPAIAVLVLVCERARSPSAKRRANTAVWDGGVDRGGGRRARTAARLAERLWGAAAATSAAAAIDHNLHV